MARRSMHIPKIKIIQHIISKILQTCYFGYLGHAWPHQLKMENFGMKKINFIPNFFLEIFERYCKLVQVGTLAMPRQICLKRQYQLAGNFNVYEFTSFLRYFKDIATCYFEYLGQKRWYQLKENIDVYLHTKNQIYPSSLS